VPPNPPSISFLVPQPLCPPERGKLKIVDGVLHVHSTGKGSSGGSRFSNDFVADIEQTHRFLKDNLHALKKNGLE
jgi:hypothetical protein